jgi:quinol monooxygenase YgiN
MSTYVVHLTLSIAPKRQLEFERLMEVEAPLTRGYDGCDLFEIYAGEQPGEIIFLEHWRSESASIRYTRWRTERGDMARLGAFFVAPPRSSSLRRVAPA